MRRLGLLALAWVAACSAPPADTVVPPRTDPTASPPSATTPRPRPEPIGPEVPPPRPERQAVLDTALDYLGVPYQYGGTDRDGLDCSALMVRILEKHGVRLPRTAAQQFRVGDAIPREALRPGDLVFFAERRRIHHVGMYLGRGEFVHASTGSGEVRVDSLDRDWFRDRYAGARDVLGGSVAR